MCRASARTEVWVRVPLDPPKRRGGFYIHTLVRVPPATSADQVAAHLTTLVAPILRERRSRNRGGMA
jgi:hypothetical protein